MIETEMNLGRLSEIIDAYGASTARWPAAERAAAEALLERSAEARRLVAGAAELDRLLDMAPGAAPSADLVARIMAARPRAVAPLPARPRRTGGWRALAKAVWPYGPPVFPAGVLAGSVALGVALGVALPSTASILALELGSGTVNAASASNGTGDQLVSIALADNDYPEEWKP